MTKKTFKCGSSFKKLQNFRLTPQDCVILNVQYRLCFTKVCETGWIFDWNSFNLGTKLNVLKNVLMRAERKVYFPWEHMSFFVAIMLRASSRRAYPAGIYLLKVNNRNTRTRFEKCSKLTIKTPQRRQWRCSGVFIVNFQHILHLVLVFLWLTLNM